MTGVEVRARGGSVQPNLAKIGDQHGSSAEVLRCLRPKVRGTTAHVRVHPVALRRASQRPAWCRPLLAPASGKYGRPDVRFIYLSDVLPTAWQGVEYAGVPDGGSLLVLGLGPIGDMACRIAQQKWIDKIIAVDPWTSGWSERWPAASR